MVSIVEKIMHPKDVDSFQSESVFNDYLKKIETINPKVNAFITTHPYADISKKDLDQKAPIVPIAIKDNICQKGVLTTCASKILQGFRPPYNATVIEKLRSHNVVSLGNVNMDEFAFGSSCETSFYGATKNPWDTNRVPGGSSGGSAASVAAGLTPWALGSDTGGSIRQPASFCGIVGLKPTYGRVSRFGLIAFASSLDQIGPLTKTVKDAAILLKLIAGFDKHDSTSVDVEVPNYPEMLSGDIKGVKIGIPKEYFSFDIDEEVAFAIKNAIQIFKDLGATIVDDISLPHTEYALSTYYIIAPSEASSNLARFDGVKYGYRSDQNTGGIVEMYLDSRGGGFSEEAKRRIILGTYTLSHGYYDAFYLKALKVRTLIRNDFENAFKECDCLLTPTSPSTAFKIGEKMDNPLNMYMSDIFTIPANLAGIPAISIPCGFSKTQLPIGLQLLGKAFDEGTILRTANAFELNTDFHLKTCPVESELT